MRKKIYTHQPSVLPVIPVKEVNKKVMYPVGEILHKEFQLLSMLISSGNKQAELKTTWRIKAENWP